MKAPWKALNLYSQRYQKIVDIHRTSMYNKKEQKAQNFEACGPGCMGYGAGLVNTGGAYENR